MKRRIMSVLTVLLLGSQMIYAQTDASRFTRENNNQVKASLPFENKDDFRDAQRGFIGTIEQSQILNEDGSVAFDLASWDFLDAEAPCHC